MRNSIVILFACVAASGCAPADAPFPQAFLFGVATAGFQNDPGCPTVADSECTDSHSDWYDFVTSPDIQADKKTFVSGEPLQHAPGSYELYQQDFDLVSQKLGGNAVRLSLEWSRIFPQSTVGIEGYDALRAAADPRALDHYHAVFAALKQRNLKPLVTLHHYTLPSWIHDAVGCHKDLGTCQRRGWLDRRGTVNEIAKYAGFAAREFGAEVDLWATLNEPFAVILPAYILSTGDRSNPPAVALAVEEARTAAIAMIEAHARMYDAVRQNDTVDADGDGKAARVGLVYNLVPAAPRDPQNPLDVQGAKNIYYLYNEFFLNAVIHGDVDMNLDGHTTHRDDLAGRMDYLGINYYTRIIVDGTEKPYLPRLSPLSTFDPLNLTLWTVYPRGLYDMVMVARSYGVPAIITENGTSDQSDPSVAQSFLVQHLRYLQRAIADGAQVEGYFFWTLVDNYEWNLGTTRRFGLFQLMQDAQKTRVQRPVVDTYRQITQGHLIPTELLQKYPLAE